MSFEAVAWAMRQQGLKSSTKFVLVAMAYYADSDMVCFPSTAALQRDTGQDRKTVLSAMQSLRSAGYIKATGERKGATGSVHVYRLTSPENGTAQGSNSNPEPVPNFPDSSAENGTTSEIEAVPNFPPSSTVFPTKRSQISRQAVPKTGHRTINEPSINHQGTKRLPPPDWLPESAWADFCQHRGAKFSAQAQSLTLRNLGKFRAQGMDPVAVLEQSIANGWTGIFPLKGQTHGRQNERSRVVAELTGAVGGEDFLGDVGQLREPVRGSLGVIEPDGSQGMVVETVGGLFRE